MNQGEGRDGCGGEAAGDFGVRIGVAIVFNQQVDRGGNRRLRVRNGSGGVPRIIEIQHLDGQSACSQLETTPQLSACEAQTLQCHTRCLIEIGESDTKASALSPGTTEATDEQSGQENPSPKRRPLHVLLNRLNVDEGAGQTDRL